MIFAAKSAKNTKVFGIFLRFYSFLRLSHRQAPGPTAFLTVVAAPGPGKSGSRHSIAGLTTPISTRGVGSSGPSSRSTWNARFGRYGHGSRSIRILSGWSLLTLRPELTSYDEDTAGMENRQCSLDAWTGWLWAREQSKD